MMGHAYRMMGLSVLLLSSVVFAGSEETKETTKTWDTYKVITEKNIFSRNRTKVLSASEIQQQMPVVSEQSYYTLRGITKQSDGYIAFLEDSRGRGVTRFLKGETVAEGRITAVTLDNISYTYGGKTLKLEIGMNLEGQVVSSGMQYASTGNGNFLGNAGFPSMGQVQGGMGQMPGGAQAQGDMGQMPGGAQVQGGGMGQMPGGQGQATGQTSTTGQFQGRGGQAPGGQAQGGMGQMPGVQGQATGQTATTGQPQARGQGPGGMMGQGQTTTGQAQTTGQTQSTVQTRRSMGQGSFTGQSQSMGQSQSTGQVATGSQTSPTVQSGTQQQGESSDEILERLKEKRKKELEE